MFFKRSFVIAFGFLMVMILAACGSYGTTGVGSYGGGSTNPPAPTTGGSNSSAVIRTATVTVKGQSESVLTNAQGLTLYYFTADTATQSAVSGNLAKIWPPQLFTGSGGPTTSTTLAGKLSVQADVNGNQVEYNGHPLYTFSGDSAPGQTNGEGITGMWFVATPNLAVQGGGSTSGSYGY
jgi:predicted lipoprotein with Yx(FWY)xxD motif